MAADRCLNWLHMGCGERLGHSELVRLRSAEKARRTRDGSPVLAPTNKPGSKR